MSNRRGSVLITAYIVLVVLLLLGGIFLSRTISDKKLFDIGRQRTEAFYLAEAAVDTALVGLKNNYATYAGTAAAVSLGRGEFEATVVDAGGSRRKITAYGYIPSKAAFLANQGLRRRIEAIAKKGVPVDFFDYALYSGGDLDFSGQHLSYDVSGKAIYAGTPHGNLSDICYTDPITHVETCSSSSGSEPAVTHDQTISPLARLDFATLQNIASHQSNPNTSTGTNVYKSQDLKQPFPTTFYYQNNPLNGPNVVYVEGAMSLKGHDTIGGFYVVVGDILTDPAVIVDTTLGGNVSVNGCIYTTGDFTLNGGGGSLNVNGGVWAGTDILVNGGGTVTYNTEFMTAIKAMVEAGASIVQLLSWRELE